MHGHPVKAIFSSEALLIAGDPKEPVVIDVWDRQWVSKLFEKAKKTAADMFAFSFRMLATQANEVIAKSGTNGMYYGPRSPCGRLPSQEHHATWLPNASFQEAKYAHRTPPQVTTLVRHGDRCGLRCDTLNAQEIHSKHRAATPLLVGKSKNLYSLGPLPFSTTKAAIRKLLAAWKWAARPLQPRSRPGRKWDQVENPGHGRSKPLNLCPCSRRCLCEQTAGRQAS